MAAPSDRGTDANVLARRRSLFRPYRPGTGLAVPVPFPSELFRSTCGLILCRARPRLRFSVSSSGGDRRHSALCNFGHWKTHYQPETEETGYGHLLRSFEEALKSLDAA